jgi:hypothetical protein
MIISAFLFSALLSSIFLHMNQQVSDFLISRMGEWGISRIYGQLKKEELTTTLAFLSTRK